MERLICKLWSKFCTYFFIKMKTIFIMMFNVDDCCIVLFCLLCLIHSTALLYKIYIFYLYCYTINIFYDYMPFVPLSTQNAQKLPYSMFAIFITSSVF